MDWAKKVFVRNAKLYELVLEGMWERGEEDALAISGLLQESGMDNCRVLDVPCGIGRIGIPLAQLGFAVTGVDYSPHLISVAKSKAARLKLEGKASFVTGSMSDLDSIFGGDSFDCAVNVFTSIGYGSEGDDLLFFRGLRRVVRKGGLFIVSGLRNRDYIAANPAQNVYEENRNLLVLDSYSFDQSVSRERGRWRIYLKVKEALKYAGQFPVDIRLYSPDDLTPMLAGSGWSVSGVYDSLQNRGPFRSGSPVYSLVAKAI